jgi:hypothetical protein
MQIVLDVTDWDAEYMETEPDLSSKERAIQARMESAFHPAKIGRFYIVARERGQTDEKILPGNKLLLMTGAAAAWSRMEAAEMKKVRLANGRDITVRSLVHAVRHEDYEEEDDGQLDMALDVQEEGELGDDKPAPVSWDNPLAMARAERYLLERIPGYIYGRLKIIAANGGDVRSVVNELQDKMEELVGRLV